MKKMNNNTIARSPGVDLDSFNNSKKGFIFNNRYVVMDLLGAGTFGKVSKLMNLLLMNIRLQSGYHKYANFHGTALM